MSQLRCVVPPRTARWVITTRLTCCGRTKDRRYQSRRVAAVGTVTFRRDQSNSVSRVSLSLSRPRFASPLSRRHQSTALALVCILQSHVCRRRHHPIRVVNVSHWQPSVEESLKSTSHLSHPLYLKKGHCSSSCGCSYVCWLFERHIFRSRFFCFFSAVP